MPTFDIVMVTHNRFEYTKRTLESLRESGAFQAASRRIYIDNASTEEGMWRYMAALSYEVRGDLAIIRTENGGWAKAVNDGLRHCDSEYVLLINNDVDFQPHFMDKMFEAYRKHPDIGLLGAWRHTAHGLYKGGIQDEVFREMDNVPAVCLLIPKKVLDEVGELTVNGPTTIKGGNGEDSTLVNKIRELGYRVGCTAVDVAYHIDGY